MSPRLPPLHSLRLFEAAARQLSFRLAAAELHLTPSAVSHGIKSLETHLGFPLFRRLNRALVLTEAGRAYQQAVSEGLALLRRGHERVLQRQAQAPLRVHMLPILASEFVIPRLQHFQQAHPAIELRIETGLQLMDFARDEVDLGLRFGEGRWPGLHSERLLPIVATPVCAPAYARRTRLRRRADLARHTLIQSSSFPQDWQLWSAAVGLTLPEDGKRLRVDSYLPMLVAAEQGLGVTLGMLPLIRHWLDSGRLTAPLPERIRLKQAFWIVYRPADAARPELVAFKRWLRAQARVLLRSGE